MTFTKGYTPWNKGMKGFRKGHPCYRTEESFRLQRERHHPAWNKGKIGYGTFNKGKKRTQENKDLLSEVRLKGIEEGRIKIWSEGTKGVCKAWNKGLTKETDERVNYYRPTKFNSKRAKEIRAKIVFPLKDTSIELKIQDFLKSLNIEFFTHYYLRQITNAYQCDILIPSCKTIIECDGDYWHGNSSFFSDEELTSRIIELRELDKIRTKELQDKGFRVIRLWEHEINRLNLNSFEDILNG